MLVSDISDPKEIDKISTYHYSELEPLYWHIEDALYAGNIDLAKSIYKDFLYIAKYRKELLSLGLQPAYIERLKELAYELNNQSYFRERKPIVIRPSISPQKLPFHSEKEVRDFLADNPDILSSVIGEEIKVVGTEVETDCEFRCDILAESQSTRFPIELKAVQADHSVVSQIRKYCYYFYRRSRYSFFKNIQGIVCSNGFCEWSINELRRDGIWIYKIIPDGDKINLEKID